jgi:hypothetical protein
VNLAVTGGMHQPEVREVVCAAVVLGHHVVHVPVLAVLQRLVTDGAETLLPPRKLPRAAGRGGGSAPPLGPVVLERRGIGGRGGRDQPLPSNLGPGERPEGPMALRILNDPSVVSADRLAPLLRRSPPTRFSRVTPVPIARRAFVHATIPCGEDRLGHPDAEVGAPAPDHRLQRLDQGYGGRAHRGAPATFELPLQLLASGLARVEQ